MVIELEKELILKCKKGDPMAFKSLVELYRSKLFGYCLKMAGDNDLAEDIFQDILIKTWKGIKKYNDRQKFTNWLFSIAHNVIYDYLRKNHKKLHNEPLNKNVSLTDGKTPHTNFVKEEAINMIEEAVNGLSKKQKEVLLLRQQSNMSFKEIANLTKQPLNTVLSHMNYAMKKIKKIIEAEYAEK